MKKFKIEKISIENFKGQTNEVEFNGDDIKLCGKNGVGKTKLMKAFFWCLSGRTDAFNSANHELFDNRLEIDENTPTAKVKVLFKIDDYKFTLERTAKAKFERVKGESTIIKAKSDDYKIFLDDVEISATKYKEFISANICPYDMLVYTMSGEFFANLSVDDKKGAIKLIQDIVGNISNEDLSGDYGLLFKMLERFNIEQLEEQTKNRIKPIKLLLGNGDDVKGELNIKIETKQETFAQLSSVDYSEIKKKIEGKEKELFEIDSKISGSNDSIKPIIEKRNLELIAISNKKAEIVNAKRLFDEKSNEEINRIEKKIREIVSINSEIKEQNKRAETEHEQLLTAKDNLSKRIASQTEILDRLRNQLRFEKESVFTAERCSYCGQELPIERLEELEAQFNENKSKKIESVKSNGKYQKSELDTLKSRLEDIDKQLSNGCPKKDLLNSEELKRELILANDSKPIFEESEQYQNLLNEIKELESNLTTMPNFDSCDLAEIRDFITKELYELNQIYGGLKTKAVIEKEIAELIKQKKENGIELAKLEGLQAQIKAYKDEIAKVSSDRVNTLLDYCQIQTKVLLKSGEYRDACDIQLHDGVRYSTANGGGLILSQIDLQRMFCKHFKIKMPIFVDEAVKLDEDKRPSFDDWQCINIVRTDDECVTVK